MLFLWALFIPIILFIWIFFLPIFVAGFIMAIPFFLVALPISLCITVAIFVSFDHIKESNLRECISSAPFHKWFGKIDLKLDLTEHHLICCHPHGVICTMAIFGIHFQPKSKTLIAVTPVLFAVPVAGWIAKHLGAIPATYKDITTALKHTSVVLLPGGVPEILSMEKHAWYENRLGFLKCAQKAGVKIYGVVNKECYYELLPMPLYDFRMQLAKRYDIPCVFPWVFGWYGTWIPKPRAIVPSYIEFEVNESNIVEQRKEYFKILHSL